MYRKIIHVDMDAFFASVEQRDFPELRGKPVAVGGGGMRGVVAAASYEARVFGVRSAMPSVTAKRLCPDLIFVKHRFDVYKEVSQQVRDIFYSYTDLVEPLSIDEAYLDVTENHFGIDSAIQIAKEIKTKIHEATNLTASAGVAQNKFLAKIASDLHKPDGITFIPPEKALEFIDQLPIGKFYGVGKKTGEKMKRLNIHTGADLRAWTELELAQRFGKAGRHYYRMVRAIDDRPVRPHRPRKSLSAERTFFEDLATETEMLEALDHIASKVEERLAKGNFSGYTVTLKIKYHDFEQRTRSQTVAFAVSKKSQLMLIAKELLHRPAFPEKPVRLLGLGVSNWREPVGWGRQLSLFEDYPS
ncbi:MAG: DNA polymerase IV [Bacteroidia bacterium]